MAIWKQIGRASAGIAFVAAVTSLSWFNLSAAVVAICASILVGLQAKAGTLIELSFGPLRAKLQRDLSEAERLVQKLQSFAALQAKMIVSAASRTGRWADSEDDWQFANLKSMEKALREMGVSEEQLRDARADLVRMTLIDLGNSALGLNHGPKRLGSQAVEELRSLRNRGLHISPDEIENYLRKWDSLTPERQIRIDDMRWIIANQDIRDRDQFLRAHSPIEWEP